MLYLVGGGFALVGAPPAQQYNLSAAGVPTDAVTGVNVVPNGGVYFDTTGTNVYLNIGTISLPVYSGFVRV